MKLEVPFVLASGSPRRRRLLDRIGMEFDVDVSHVEEYISEGAQPAALVEELAIRKARDVSARHPDSLTLGADTIVVLDNEILGKPSDADEATEMLRRLSNNTHVVYTGIALVYRDRVVTQHEATRVTFVEMTDDEIEAYIASGSPMDKAGAYGIQDDRGALFVRRIEGDYYNVVGLPLQLFYRTIKMHYNDLLAPDYFR